MVRTICLACDQQTSLEILLEQFDCAINHTNNTMMSITFSQRSGSDVGPVTMHVRENGPTAHLRHNTEHFSIAAESRSTHPFIA